MGACIQKQLIDSLEKFESHSLGDLKKAELMDRVDTKFILPVSKLPEILDALREHYTVLEINGKRCFRYRSVYFDTSCHSLYKMHHSGRLNRFKVRMRSYEDSGSQFLEVKFKNNKKRTIKSRVPLDSACNIDLSHHQKFLSATGLPKGLNLTPSLANSYQRIAFASEARGERLTVDLNLTNENFLDQKIYKTTMEDIAIVELKQSRVDRSSPFFKLIREIGIRPSSFSKYCMGLTITQQDNQNFKSNRFKCIFKKMDRLKNLAS